MAGVRVAVVTGGNKGVGLAVVRALCKQFQGDVYLTARNPKLGEEAVRTLNIEGLSPLFHQLDITDVTGIRALRDFLMEKYGGLDVLVNNAGIAFRVADTTPFGIQAEVILKTNFFATRDVCSELLPLIRPNGRLVNISSIFSHTTLPKCSPELQERFRSDTITEDELVKLMEQFVEDAKNGVQEEKGWPTFAYGVSKIGVTVLSRIQARQLKETRKREGIIVNSCCPGWVRTGMTGPDATKSPDEGAITPVYLALLPTSVDSPYGELVSDKKILTW
ncbi:carbonyl reductase [NADPH] 1-like [Anomaloglossus baeobatrachus]|uniref:carbonyl reductase [NADPH] 1-like n=1 Tax=Anomaloglossus baeobatrachus TaxID=238106 RepID=UPI003F50904D